MTEAPFHPFHQVRKSAGGRPYRVASSGALALLALTFLWMTPVVSAEEELDPDALMEQWLRMEDPDDLDFPDSDELREFRDLDRELDDLWDAVPPWDLETRLLSGAGYRDNMQLSAAAPEGGLFLLAGLESTISRVSSTGRSLVLVLDAEHLHFPSSTSSNDTFASAFAQIRTPVADDSELSFSLLTFYLDQVIDPSTVDFEQEPMPIRVRGANATSALRTQWRDPLFTEIALGAGKHLLADPFSDYWEFGPKATIGSTWDRSEMAFSLQYLNRDYDDRQARSEDGQALPGTNVAFHIVRPELTYNRTWGDSWRSRSRLGLETVRDDETGYFDYDRVRLSQQLGFRGEHWEIKGQVQYSYFDYKEQRVEDDRLRNRQTWGASIEVQRKFLDQFDIFARYDWQNVRSNESGTDYSVNTWGAGLGWRF